MQSKGQDKPNLVEVTPATQETSAVPIQTTYDNQNICLFSNHVSASIEENLAYMEKKYGFFIIHSKSCVNKKGLLKYLGKLVHVTKKCISCDQMFKTGRDCQKHMIDKQHCFMDPDDFEQYEKYYDFSEENRIVAKRMQEKFGHLQAQDSDFVYAIEEKKTKVKAIKAKTGADGEDEESWEDVDSDDQSAAEITEGDKAAGQSSNPEDKTSKKEWYNLRKVKVLSTGELRLPSGRIAGHRDYLRFYKQSLKADKEETALAPMMRDRAMHRRQIEMQQGMLAKFTGKNDATQLMIQNYGQIIGRMRKIMEKGNKRLIRLQKTQFLKFGVRNHKLMTYFVDRNMIING